MVRSITAALFFLLAQMPLALAQSATENNEVIIETSLDKERGYVQEQLVFSIKLYYSLSFERGATFSRPVMSDAAVSRLGESLTYTETIDGVDYSVNENRFAIFPQNSGQFTIEPIRFRAYTQTRSTRDDPNLRTTERRELIELQSEPLQVEVLPVPADFPSPDWLPSSQVTVSESWSGPLDSIRLGDSIVRTIHIKATGLFSSMLANLDFTEDTSMRYYPTTPNQVDIRENTGTRSEHIQNITLVATEAGPVTLPAVEIPWWNTATDSLEVARLPARQVDVLTAEGLRLEPENEEMQNQTGNSGFLGPVNLNLILFVGVLVLVSALFFAPALVLVWQKLGKKLRSLLSANSSTTDGKTKGLPEINSSFSRLKKACEQQQLDACSRHFISWGQAYFQNPDLYSLHKLADKFRQAELNGHIRKLQSSLYGAGRKESDFEFNAFLECVSALHQERKQRSSSKTSYHLPPLYRN